MWWPIKNTELQSGATYYLNLESVSTLTKLIIIYFQNINSFLNFEIIIFFIIYYNIVIWELKFIQSVVCDNYYDFQHVNFIFSQIFISLFWGLFNDEADLRVRYTLFGRCTTVLRLLPSSASKLHEFGSKIIISWAKPAHFALFAINLCVESRIKHRWKEDALNVSYNCVMSSLSLIYCHNAACQ